MLTRAPFYLGPEKNLVLNNCLVLLDILVLTSPLDFARLLDVSPNGIVSLTLRILGIHRLPSIILRISSIIELDKGTSTHPHNLRFRVAHEKENLSEGKESCLCAEKNFS